MIPAGSERTPLPPVAKAPGSGRWRMSWGKIGAACEPPGHKPGLWPALVTAVLIFPVFLTLPTGAPDLGIDSSWCAVLNWAEEHGLHFGRDVVFTYGPLGFLTTPYYFGQPAYLLVGANALLCFLVALGLCLMAWRVGLLWRWVLLILFVFESANVESRADLILETGFLCWGLLCFIESGRPRQLCLAGWMGLIVFAGLAKASYLFIGAYSVCILSVHLLLSGEKRTGIALLPCFGGALALGWMASGQAIANLAEFVVKGFQISRGYDQAAGLEGLAMLRAAGWLLGAAVLASIVAYAAAAGISAERGARGRLVCVVAWLLGLYFAVWKHSLVRVDRYHIIELAAFGPVIALALEMWPGTGSGLRWAARTLALVCCLISFELLRSTFLPDLASAAREPFRQFAYHLRAVWRPGAWKGGMEPTLNELRKQAQLPDLKKALDTGSVDVFGSSQAYAILNDFNYRPRPVFQSYAAYSAPLARLNEDFYLSDRAPDYVMFELAAPEHRFPGLNDSLALRALLMNYRPSAMEGPFLLLKHEGAEKARLTLVQEGKLAAGAKIEVGQYAGTNLWMELEVAPTVTGRLAQWLARSAVLRLASWNGPKLIARERAAAPLLRIGFLASPCLMKTEDAREFYEGKPVNRPSGYSVEFAPGTERFWKQEIRFRVYRIENGGGGKVWTP